MKAIQESLRQLVAGNLRYVTNKPKEKDYSYQREATIDGQKPYACIVSCSDSRVPPEIVFDAGLGDLFVVRTAGHVVDSLALGSIEYAVHHLNVPLILVLGHQKCGAVTAAVEGSEEEGDIVSVVEAILPAIEVSEGQEGDAIDNAVNANALMVAKDLVTTSDIIEEAVKVGELKIVSARYELETGKVILLS